MTVTEPATMLTDYALTLACAWFALSLLRRGKGRKVGLWVAAFLMTAFAAVAGGTAHGFRIPLGESHRLVWTITVAAIAAGSARYGGVGSGGDGGVLGVGRRVVGFGRNEEGGVVVDGEKLGYGGSVLCG